MSFTIGDPVKSRVSDFAGFVADVRGGPDGPLYIVRSPVQGLTKLDSGPLNEPLGRAETFKAEDLEPGDPTPRFQIGQLIKLHGGLGRITERNGEFYTVEVKRTRRSFAFVHRYHLPAWRIAIGGGS